MSGATAQLRVEGVGKAFGQGIVLGDISLDVAPGEFLALIGPSGCGKSTLLRIISGLESPDGGRILLAGRDVTGTRAADRDIAMVFQSYALYPHLTARQNMALPLVMRRLTAAQRLPFLGRLLGSRAALREIAAEVEAAATSLKIGALLDRKPARMSGGQRQRVALGRAIVRHPRVFLMDEPLSNLDVALRVHMRGEIVDLHRRLRTTTIYVTHDQAEALSMADRIAVMMNGRVLQIDKPDVLYRDPNHIDVAEFVGSPKINVLAAAVDGSGVARCGGIAVVDGFQAVAGMPVRLGMRPEGVEILAEARDGALPALLERLEFQGSEILAHMRAPGGEPIIGRLPPGRMGLEPGRTVHLQVPASAWLAFGPDGQRIRPASVVLNLPVRHPQPPVPAPVPAQVAARG